jgi:hypothetical protein
MPFPEEQLDSPVGYFHAHPGQTLRGGQWTIVHKLGWGPQSSTWLALDNEGYFSAIKILTVAATEGSAGKNERDFLLGPLKNAHGISWIRNHFYERDTQGKNHNCLILCVLGSSVEDLRLSNANDGKYLPVHIVQKVIGDISQRLGELADRKVIHGGGCYRSRPFSQALSRTGSFCRCYPSQFFVPLCSST